jgi:hypothetical protein
MIWFLGFGYRFKNVRRLAASANASDLSVDAYVFLIKSLRRYGWGNIDGARLMVTYRRRPRSGRGFSRGKSRRYDRRGQNCCQAKKIGLGHRLTPCRPRTGACDKETLVDVLIFPTIRVLGFPHRSRETAVERARAVSGEWLPALGREAPCVSGSADGSIDCWRKKRQLRI